jgi:hypothetical protein
MIKKIKDFMQIVNLIWKITNTIVFLKYVAKETERRAKYHFKVCSERRKVND